MKKVVISSVGELKGVLSNYGKSHVYRGQCKNYPDDNSAPSLLPSFWAGGGRSACVPALRQRWSSYASFIIYAILGHNNYDHDLCEAILQHYGWKSFFIDLTTSPSVAAWFASHQYSQKNGFHVCEDCWEIGVFLKNLEASYGDNEANGHLYVLDKEAIEKVGLKLFDLSILKTKGKTRADVQRAFLAGPFSNKPLPLECIVCHIEGPASVFRDYSIGEEFKDTGSIFPSPADDPIYNHLLSTPWIKIPIPDDGKESIKMNFYRRFLEIPDYYDSFKKRLPPSVALYDGFSIHDAYEETGKPFKNPVFVQTDDPIYFSPGYPEIENFPELRKLVSQWDMVIFELDIISSRPEHDGDDAYTKGMVIEKINEDVIEISELIVEHPGTKCAGVGTEQGWHYKFGPKAKLTRFECKEDCACGNSRRHEFHMEALKRIEECMQGGYEQISERLFKLKG